MSTSLSATGPIYIRPGKRRGVELALLLLAILVGVGTYAATTVNRDGTLPTDLPVYAGVLVAFAVVAHVAIRVLAPYADPVLLPCAMFLNGLGLGIIHRLDLSSAGTPDHTGGFLPGGDGARQLIWTAVGVAVFVVVLGLVRDHRRLQRGTYTLGLLGILLLLLPLIPKLGLSVEGARLWISVAGLSFQPGEVAKFVLIIFFAGYLVVKRDALALAGRRFLGVDLPRGRDLGPILVAWLVSVGILVFEQDLGISLLFFGIFVVMLYVSTERPGWLAIGAVLFAVGAYVSYTQFGRVRIRVGAWLDPFAHAQTTGYQMVQSLYGLAFGGILGKGLGLGRPDMVPLAKSDFIISAVGEELGLTGLMAVILVFGLVVERALRISLICRDPFGKLLAAGCGVAFCLQVFVVVGGVTRLIPMTGLTTPFMSYGGSSLVANWALVALLLRISDHARRPVVTPAGAPFHAAAPVAGR